MGRLRRIINDIKLNKEIERWRKIETKKTKRASEEKMVCGKDLSEQEKQEIKKYYSKYTKERFSYFWHLKYKTISGKFCCDYFPEVFYNADLKHRLNDKVYTEVYSNKYVLSRIVSGSNIGVLVPTNYVSCNEEILLNEQNLPISKNSAISLLLEKEKLFIKKSIGTYGGDECKLLTKPSEEEIENIINNYGKNYLIQNIIENQEDIKTLNPSTLNTFRVITFFANGAFRTSPLILRIGRKDHFLDNAHAGGMFVAVSDEGVIVSDAKNVLGETFKTHPDSHIVFKGYKISNVQKLKDKAIELANLFPQTKLIDWDLTIDKNGNIVCIEANIDSGSIWLMQMTHGTPIFGQYTEEMLQYVHHDNIFKILKNNL